MDAVRDITISIGVQHRPFVDKCTLSDDEMASLIYDLIEPERNQLATAVRLAIIQLTDGETKEAVETYLNEWMDTKGRPE